MVRTGIARLEFVHYSAHGSTGDFAHLASECAADQDRFWEFHDQLMSRNRGLYNQAGARAHAATLGMDAEQFEQCLRRLFCVSCCCSGWQGRWPLVGGRQEMVLSSL